jgi:transposase-like protein
MTADNSVTPARWPAQQIETGDPDMLRSMVKTMAETLLSAMVFTMADSLCAAGYGERSEERTNSRNGSRQREWDTRAGTVAVALLRRPDSEAFGRW